MGRREGGNKSEAVESDGYEGTESRGPSVRGPIKRSGICTEPASGM